MRPLWAPLLACLLPAALSHAPAAAAPRYFEDATLRAVQLVDDREGWAVGDQGVIWHTIDGGQTWTRQSTGVRASLRSVCFPGSNPYEGWVVGRDELPGAGSSGVVLHTRDGGLHWKPALMHALPGLNRVCFADAQNGYLLGDGTDAYPSGVFLTRDGGRSWKPLPGPRSPGWLAADFSDGSTGALAGAWNRLATLRDGKLYAKHMDTLGGRSLLDLHLRRGNGLAVGQGGLILRSDGSSGKSWSFVSLPSVPADDVRPDWDFHAVHGTGSHYWVVGRPGSMILHSDDLGKTWQLVPTGQTMPLHGVFFQSADFGVAVGALGTILVTRDGGKTWKAQQRGGERAALLFVHARSAGLPADAVSFLGAQEGYLTAAVRVTSPDPGSADLMRWSEGPRFGAAFRLAGGTAAETLWQFPLPSHLARAGRNDLLAAWNDLHADRAPEHLLRQLVLAIRTWRPSVIITDPPGQHTAQTACDSLIGEAVREAFARAADPKAFPEQLSVLGLAPWEAVKAYGCGDAGRVGQVSLDLTGISPVLQCSARDFAREPAYLLEGSPVSPPARRTFHLLAARSKDALSHHDLMQGVECAPGGLARRLLPRLTLPSEDLVKGLRQAANLEMLAQQPPSRLTNPQRLLGQLGPMLDHLPDEHAAPAAHAVACHLARSGQWELAREAFLFVADRYSTHPLGLDACRWLIRYHSSSEARRRRELGQLLVVEQISYGVPSKAVDVRPAMMEPEPSQKKSSSPDAGPTVGEGKHRVVLPKVLESNVERTGGLMTFPHEGDVRRWYQGCLEVEPRLDLFGSLPASDPSLQFCLQAARRNLGDVDAPCQWYSRFAAEQPDGPWRQAALAELWLRQRTGAPPKPVLQCRFTETRPRLDGKLNDACWQAVRPTRLQEAAGKTREAQPTEVRLAYDHDFLYVAVTCRHPARKPAERPKQRVRDADLRGHDRVSLLLDLDRDYCTCFELQVDERGCVRESCWGDTTWDPRWFVAVHNEETGWQVEAAIPLKAMTGDIPTPGKAWACNVIRTIPGQGVQAWSLPAEAPDTALRLEGLGLLMFRRDDVRASQRAMSSMQP
jgi:photosystem II stability/assembly factor-like uncharacterized protein